MKKVYVLIDYVDSEDIIGVYSTLDKAIMASRESAKISVILQMNI